MSISRKIGHACGAALRSANLFCTYLWHQGIDLTLNIWHGSVRWGWFAVLLLGAIAMASIEEFGGGVAVGTLGIVSAGSKYWHWAQSKPLLRRSRFLIFPTMPVLIGLLFFEANILRGSKPWSHIPDAWDAMLVASDLEVPELPLREWREAMPPVPSPVAGNPTPTARPEIPKTPPPRKPPFFTLYFYSVSGQPRFSIVNTGDDAGIRPKWTIALSDYTNEYYPHYPSDPGSSEPLPIPTNEVDDFVKGHSYSGNFEIFNTRALELLKPGDNIFGIIGIGCMNCTDESKFWFYWQAGQGGWYAPFSPLKPGAEPFKRPNLSNEEASALISAIVPLKSRIAIVEGKGWEFDLKKP